MIDRIKLGLVFVAFCVSYLFFMDAIAGGGIRYMIFG